MESTHLKKTLFLNRAYILKAKRILNARTKTETVNRALEIVLEENEIIQAHREIGGAGHRRDTLYGKQGRL